MEHYTEANNNARAYMDLRFKHFGTFVLMMGLAGGAMFSDKLAPSARPYLGLFMMVLTVLFWLLDYRTAYHQKTQIAKIAAIEKARPAPSHAMPSCRLPVSASLVTNLIFLAVLLVWFVILFGTLESP